MGGTTTIIVMASMSVASGVTSGVLNALGKQQEAQYVNFATVSLIVVTALAAFAKVIQAIKNLGV